MKALKFAYQLKDQSKPEGVGAQFEMHETSCFHSSIYLPTHNQWNIREH